MRIRNYIAFAFAALLTVSCSDVSEDERFTYIKPQVGGRCVLIEDFTGQNCPNCPKATKVIEQLQAQYTGDTVIAVAIHSGPFGVWDTPGRLGLRTKTGDEYFKHFNIEAQPSGIINRFGGPLQFSMWTAATQYMLKQQSKLNLALSNQYDPATRQVNISLQAVGTQGDINGKVQIWLTEDSIIAYQIDGRTEIEKYTHNHVFRDAVNGTWGEDFKLGEGQSRELSYSYKLPEAWEAKHVSVVAFVYNDQEGVLQVTRKAVIQTKE